MSFWSKVGSIAKTVVKDVYQDIQKEQAKKSKTNIRGINNTSEKADKPQRLNWSYIGTLDNVANNDLRHVVGLYKAVLNGKTVYIGRAVEYSNGGLKKRLADYTRQSDSARKHKSGQLMHQNASDLKMYVMVTGSDSEAANRARELETEMINRYRPEWNVQYG